MKRYLAVILVLVAAQFALAVDRTVGSGKSYANIQAAYAAAESGDTITVDDGTYAEDGTGGLLLLDADIAITIRSATGTATACIIRAASATSGVISHANGNLTLQHLTVDGTGVTGVGSTAIYSEASGDNITLTGVLSDNLGANTSFLNATTGTNGTITLTGCTVVSLTSGLIFASATTTVIIDSTTISAVTPVSLGAAITTATIRNESALTATTGHGLTIAGNVTVGALNVTDSTITGGTGAGSDGIHLDTGDTVTTLTISGSAILCAAESGAAAALEIGGTCTALSVADSSTLSGGDAGVGLAAWDGTNYAAGTWLKLRGSTISSTGLSALVIPQALLQVDISGCTISSSDSADAAMILGEATVAEGSENAAPLGMLRFSDNSVSKAGTTGNCAHFGSGCGKGVVEGNQFTGGAMTVAIEFDYLKFAFNRVYNAAADGAAVSLLGAQYCVLRNNSIYTTGATALFFGPNNLADVTQQNFITNNIVVSTKATGQAIYHGGEGGDSDAVDNVLDYNLYYVPSNATSPFEITSTVYATLALLKAGWLAKYPGKIASLNDANSLYGNPYLIAPVSGNWNILRSSPAFGAASDGGDIGAVLRLDRQRRIIRYDNP